MIVFGVVDILPFMPSSPITKNWVAFGVSMIVGFLSVVSLDEKIIRSILLSYDTLGITLTAIIPFAIIMVLSYKFYEQGYLIFSKFAWIVFLVVLASRWWYADIDKIGMFGNWVYPIILIITLIMLFFEKGIYRIILREETSAKIDKFREELRKEDARRRAEARSVDEVTRRR